MNNSLSSRFLFAYLLFLPVISSAQQEIDGESFFEIASAGLFSNEVGTQGPVKIPWIEEYEIRTETRDFEFNRQEYTFRLSPNSPKKRRAQTNLSQHISTAPDFEYTELNCELIEDIYSDWLDLYFLQQYKAKHQELLAILKRQRSTLQQMASIHDFELQKIINAEADISDLEITLVENDSDISFILKKYDIENLDLDFQYFKDLEGLTVDLAKQGQETNFTQYPELAYELELLNRELMLEEAEQSQYFDFAQLRYIGPHDDPLNERISIGLGFRIPNSGNRRLNMQEIRLERERLERDVEFRKNLKKESLSLLKEEIFMDISTYSVYESMIGSEREKMLSLQEQINRKEGGSPLLVLDMDQRHVETQIEALKKKRSIYRKYIEYLEESRALCLADSMLFLSDK